MKTSLTSFDICALSHEFQRLMGGWIGKVYQPSRNDLLIRIRADNDKFDLHVNNGNWITFTPTKKSRAMMTLHFCNDLSKISKQGKDYQH